MCYHCHTSYVIIFCFLIFYAECRFLMLCALRSALLSLLAIPTGVLHVGVPAQREQRAHDAA